MRVKKFSTLISTVSDVVVVCDWS